MSGYRFYNRHPAHRFVDDCTKRSISLTCGMPYLEVQKGLNAHKRITGVKVFYNTPNPHSYVENVLGFPRVKLPRRGEGSRMTVGEFAKAHPTGRYILSISGHWTSLIDGVVYDTWDCTDRALLSYYQVTRFERTKIEKKYCFTTRKEGDLFFVSVYDGNGQFATRVLDADAVKKYQESLLDRGFFNFDEMGEYI